MSLYRVTDIQANDLEVCGASGFLAASGYESRATAIPTVLRSLGARSAKVFGFDESKDLLARTENDRYFRTEWSQEAELATSNDSKPILEYLNRLQATRSDPSCVRVIVDYSCMSRVWYCAVVNWARYQARFSRVVVDFLYMPGEHEDHDPPMAIEEILALPGCEGRSAPRARSVAIFGLGFDAFATLCVFDRLEPDVSYGYLASPGILKYDRRIREANSDLIDKELSLLLTMPLRSVETTFAQLGEVVAPHLGDDAVTLVPMGPKTHVLASILLSVRFPAVACLRVSGTNPKDVRAGGELVATRVEFRHARGSDRRNDTQ